MKSGREAIIRIAAENQFTGCLVGQCVGDACGFIVEGAPPDACREYVDAVLRAGNLEGRQRGGFRFGQYSDDSQLARELLESYASCRHFDPADYAGRIAAIFKEERIVGHGRATLESAKRLMAGTHWEKSGAPPPSAGNGSAMRAAPIGLLFYDDPEGMIKAAHDQGRITHQDRRCSAGAIAIAGAVTLILRDEICETGRFSIQLSDWVRPFDAIFADALQQMPKWIELPPDKAVRLIARVGLSREYSDCWQGISPFVTGSVLWSLYAFLASPDDYLQSIETAIAVGGDVDTTAAMTGAISGARVGLEGIPESLSKHLTDRNTWSYHNLQDLARTCYSVKHSK